MTQVVDVLPSCDFAICKNLESSRYSVFSWKMKEKERSGEPLGRLNTSIDTLDHCKGSAKDTGKCRWLVSNVHSFFFFFCFFRATPAAYGSSQARGQIRATAATCATATATQDLGHICDLYHSPQQHRILNPLSKSRDRTGILMDASWVRFRLATTGTPSKLSPAAEGRVLHC